MTEDLGQGIRDSGFLDALMPADEMLHDAAIRQAVDAAGRLNPDVANDIRTPITLDWSTIDGRPKRSPQAGTIVLLWAHANTPPTSTCTISYSVETKQIGVTSGFVTLTIEAGQAIGEVTLSQPVPAGAFLNPSVTVAGGASAVSTGVVIKV